LTYMFINILGIY